MINMFTPTSVEKNFYVDSVIAENRGKTFRVDEVYGEGIRKMFKDAKVHDANFAFLTTTLAKLHTKLYEPIYNVTYGKDIPIDLGGGFVDYVSYYTVDWAGIMNEFRNVVGNNANYIPRVNAGLTQKKANVYTFEVAYDLRWVELEKMKTLTLQKSIEEIYRNAIVAGWDFFVEKIAYLGGVNGTGLFNNANVSVTMIDNNTATGKGFTGMTDAAITSFFNGIFEYFLLNSNMNGRILPNKILVPTYVGKELTSRNNDLYTSTLRKFLIDHNLGTEEMGEDFKVEIESRPDLDTLGTGGHGRIVAYNKNIDFVRIDMPYPMQHYITLPNVDKMGYTSAFVGQVSEIQMPYNTNKSELGPVSYWDFSK